LKNLEAMWKAGVPAIPTYHIGEPWDVLEGIARDYPKIAMGGMADVNPSTKLRWGRQCFARAWPKKIHGFACASEAVLKELPFHSVDATSWTSAPRYNSWVTLGRKGRHKAVRGADFRAEFQYYVRMGERFKSYWGRTLASLETGNARSDKKVRG